jgi:hypothetical protein
MRTDPTSAIILRLVFAILFGVMSMLPVPLRALAHPAPIPHVQAATAPDAARQHAAHGAARHHGPGVAGHHHGGHLAAVTPADDEPGAPQPGDGALPCQSAPCCMAVTQPVPSAPATVLLLLGQLSVPPAQIIVAVTPDPAVPPPRLPA